MDYVLAWFEETDGGISYLVSKAFINVVEFVKFMHFDLPINWELIEYYENNVRKVINY